MKEFKGQPPSGISSIGFTVTNYSEQEFEWQLLNIRAFESR